MNSVGLAYTAADRWNVPWRLILKNKGQLRSVCTVVVVKFAKLYMEREEEIQL